MLGGNWFLKQPNHHICCDLHLLSFSLCQLFIINAKALPSGYSDVMVCLWLKVVLFCFEIMVCLIQNYWPSYISAQIFSCQSTWSLYWQLALCFDQFKQIKEILVIYDTWRLPKFSSATKKDCGMFRLEVNKMKMGWWWWLRGMGGDLGSGFQGSYLTTQKPRKSQSWMQNWSSLKLDPAVVGTLPSFSWVCHIPNHPSCKRSF